MSLGGHRYRNGEVRSSLFVTYLRVRRVAPQKVNVGPTRLSRKKQEKKQRQYCREKIQGPYREICPTIPEWLSQKFSRQCTIITAVQMSQEGNEPAFFVSSFNTLSVRAQSSPARDRLDKPPGRFRALPFKFRPRASRIDLLQSLFSELISLRRSLLISYPMGRDLPDSAVFGFGLSCRTNNFSAPQSPAFSLVC